MKTCSTCGGAAKMVVHVLCDCPSWPRHIIHVEHICSACWATNGKLWFPYHDRLTVSEIGREFNPSTDRRPRT